MVESCRFWGGYSNPQRSIGAERGPCCVFQAFLPTQGLLVFRGPQNPKALLIKPYKACETFTPVFLDYKTCVGLQV